MKREKMIKLLFVFILVLHITLYAQDNCQCSEALDQLIIKVESEYPGYKDKVKDTLAYTSFKKHLVESSFNTNNDNCIKILKAYTSYFKDGHLVINKKGNDIEDPQIIARDTFETNLTDFNNYLMSSKDSLEGIWVSGGYKVGLIKDSSNYVAFVITAKNDSWKTGEIKFKLDNAGKAIYYWGDHTQTIDSYNIHKGCFIHFKKANIAFVRESPAPLLTKENIAEELNELEGFYLKAISDKTLLLRISSFEYSNTERIKNLFESNKHLLDEYENLIIDVRGNGGGTDNNYRPILPYIYTNPVRQLSGEYLVTQTLMNALLKWANSADQNKDAEEIELVRSDLKRMEGKVGEFIPYSADANYGFTKQDSVYLYPKNVAILVDGHCGSSTEKFILDAKQSKKVKILGTPTYGSVDYVLVYEFGLDCSNYALFMPTVRMMRLPEYRLDNIGIQPDIYMDKYIDDWVQYAKDYLEN